MTPDFKDDQSLLETCPVCLRTIWRNSDCHHGTVPSPSVNAPREAPVEEPKQVKRRKGDRRSDPFYDDGSLGAGP